MSKNQLLKNAFLLSGASIFSRILGLIYRIFLSRIIGAEGIGLFQMLLPFYGLMSAFATLGLPGAVSKMVADRVAQGNINEAEEIKLLSVTITCISSILTALFFWFSLPFLTINYLPDSRLDLSLKLFPFIIIFAAISAVWRGYFQGRRKMFPPAISQILETLARVSFGLLGAIFLLPYGLKYAIVGLTLGILFGEIIGLVVLIAFNVQPKNFFNLIRKPRSNISEMFGLALPLIILRLSGSLTHTVETFLIPSRLKAIGFSAVEATILFGRLNGMAFPLIFLPTVAVIPFNSALLPSISIAISTNNKQKLLHFIKVSISGTMGLGILTTAIILIFSVSLVQFLYDDITVAPLIVQLAPAAPFALMQITTTTILHGMGHPSFALLNDLIGTGIMLTFIYYLTSIPTLGIRGTIWSYIIGYIIITLLDCIFIFYYYNKFF